MHWDRETEPESTDETLTVTQENEMKQEQIRKTNNFIGRPTTDDRHNTENKRHVIQCYK